MKTSKTTEVSGPVPQLKPYFIFLLFFLFSNQVNGQVIIDLVECPGDCIWTTQNGIIQSWDVNSTSPQIINTEEINSCQGFSIGYVKINNDTTLNTFISVDNDCVLFKYWNGQTWLDYDDIYVEGVLGIGSFQNHLYILSFNLQEGSIVHYYDGDTLIKVNADIPFYSGSDIAVDQQGRAWLSTIQITTTDIFTDTINVFNASGSEFLKLPLNEPIFGSGNYGNAIVNDTLYMGFGAGNATYPNQIIAVAISDNVAQVTDKIIDFGVSNFNFYDLASLSPSSQITSSNHTPIFTDNNIQTSPNPFNESILIERSSTKKSTVLLFSAIGELMYQAQVEGNNFKIDTKKLASGIYFLHIDKVVKKIIKN